MFNAPFSIPRIVALTLIASVSTLFALSPTQEAAFPKIQKKDVLAFRDQNMHEWMTRVSAGKSRLFYNESEWKSQTMRIAALTGRGAELRQALFDAADRIVEMPIPTYVPPEKGKNAPEGWQRGYGDSLVCLAAATRIDPKPRYREKLRQMVLAGCHFDSWGREGKQGELPNMDLATSHMACGIAMGYDWNRELFTTEEKEFIRTTVRQRMTDMMRGLYGDIFWSNWYTQNHNHVAVAGLGLAGAAFLGEIPEASEWLSAAVLNFRAVADSMYADGSIYEGVLYWNYGRTFIMQFVEAIKPIVKTEDFYAKPFLKNCLAFRVASSIPGFNGVLLWGDTRGYDAPQPVLYRLAAQYHDGQGQYLADHLPYAPNIAGVAWSLLWYDPSVAPAAPTALDYHASVWDVTTSRSGWGPGDYMFSMKSGYNRNHHTKTDAGSLTLNVGGQWLLLAPGYGMEPHGGGFFDQEGKRWLSVSNDAESHSTLLINGLNQRYDREAKGTIDRYASGPSALLEEADLTQAYQGVDNVRRRVLHRRGDYLLVLDEVKTPSPATVEWLGQVPPSAKAEGGRIAVKGMAGSLLINRLDANCGPFVKREPTAPIHDVSPSRITTYSSKTEGSEIRLATLLQPSLGNPEAAPFKTTLQDDAKGRHIAITGGNWNDDCWLKTPAASFQADNVSAVAELLSIRRVDGKIVSWIVSAATELDSPRVKIQSKSPFTAALENFQEGAILDLGEHFQGTVSVSPGTSLFTSDGKSLSREDLAKLGAGRYFLGSKPAVAANLQRGAAALFPPHALETNIPVNRLPEQPALSAKHRIQWEAEENALQTEGDAKVFSRQGASGQKALVNFGSESPAHTVGWVVDVPQAGTYELSARYAVDQPKVNFIVTVDGAAPSQEALNASLPGPKAWGPEKYFVLNIFNWMEIPVAGASGKPLALPLTAGKHEIRLWYPNTGINLDFLTLSGLGSTDSAR